MTKELRAALEIILKHLATNPKKVLEIGSRVADNQDEICNLRPLLPRSKYVGVDMQPGRGVDVVADANNLPYSPASFDLVMCLETLEHAREPWQVASEIKRVVKKNGAVILSSQQNFPLHMHPSDYFRYTPYGLASLVSERWERVLLGISPPYDAEVRLNPRHVIVIAWNGGQWNKKKLVKALKQEEARIGGHKPYRHRLWDALKIMRRALNEARYRQEIHFFE